MNTVIVLSEDEDEQSQVTTTESSVTSSSSDSPWDQLSNLEPYLTQMDSDARPTCVPPLYDSRKDNPLLDDKRRFYNVYAGDLVGCYREWGDVSGRVTGVPGNRHKSYATWELALEAWQQNCRAYHRHAPEFLDGSTFRPNTPLTLPEPVTPRRSQHNVIVVSSPSTTHSTSSSSVSRASTHPPKPSGKSSIFTPTCTRRAPSTASSSRPPSPSHRRRYAWAIHGTEDNRSIVTTAKADTILKHAVDNDEEVVIRQVASVTEAAEWFERLEVRSGGSV